MNTFETDTIYVNLNSGAAESVKQYYADLGWQVSGERKKRLRKNFIQVAFSRPHGIADKDELLLLQVRLDIALNRMGKISAGRKSRAVWAGTCLGLAALVFFLQGALLFTLFTVGTATAVFGGLALLFGVMTAVSGGVIAAKLYRADGIICAEEVFEQLEIIRDIRVRARGLRRADDGQE